MTIVITSVFVDDQSKALALYTDVLGFRVNLIQIAERARP
jgi:catechol 2,3-dioxygenase-like lactoylglutathione lyase family enzyme